MQTENISRLRFWSKVTKTDKCWLWQGANIKGYGKLGIGGQSYLAHRLSYMWNVGPIPDGLNVLHTCDTPPCVLPSHLFLGTQGDNLRDAASKGRTWRPQGEIHGRSKLNDESIKEIRYLGRKGYSHRKIGKIFGIHNVTVGRILSGKAWGHLC